MKFGEISITRDGKKITIQVQVPLDAFTETQMVAIPEPPKEDKLIPIKAAPDIARCSKSTLDRMKDAGEIGYVKIRNRVFFYESVLIGIRQEIRLKGVKY